MSGQNRSGSVFFAMALVCMSLGVWAQIPCDPPVTPGNPSPANGMTTVPLTTSFTWTGPATKLAPVNLGEAAKTDAGVRPFPEGYDPKAIPEGKGVKSAKVAIPFVDDAEGGVNGWTTTGFWRQITNPENLAISSDINPRLVHLPDGAGQLPAAYSGATCWWYGEESTGTFIGSDFWTGQEDNTGGRSSSANAGDLISPPLNLIGASQAVLSFMTWWEIEGVDVNTYDMMHVDISTDGGVNYAPLGKGSINPANDVDGESWRPYSSGGLGEKGQWINVQFDLTQYVNQTVVIRFRFETRDNLYNGFRGWFIDNISITNGNIPAPVIDQVTPSAGPQGALFYVTGSNFANGAIVKLGNYPAQTVVVSANEAQVVVPSIPYGLYDVTLTNPDGQSVAAPATFEIVNKPAPGILSIDPAWGYNDQPTPVTILCENLDPAATANVGGIALEGLAVNGQTITGTVPTGLPLGFQNVNVTNEDEQFGTLVGGFQVVAPCAEVYDVYLDGILIGQDLAYRTCTPPYLLEGTTYSWQVIAKVMQNGQVQGETPSDMWTFTTETLRQCPIPNPPANPSPADGDINITTHPTFSWAEGTPLLVKGDPKAAVIPPSPVKAGANGDLFTTDDNQDNDGTGNPDGDMNIYLYRGDPGTPIEFDVYWPGGAVPDTVQLLISAWDVDETSGEVDNVYLNGNLLGIMTGANDEWSTTTFAIEDPTLLQEGSNLVKIEIDDKNEGWAIQVDWAQMTVNGVVGQAAIRSAATDKAVYMSGETVTGTVEVDTTLTEQNIRVETNLLDMYGINVAGTSTTYVTTGGNDDPYSVALALPADAAAGSYTFQVLVFDVASMLVQDEAKVPFNVGQCGTLYDVYLNGMPICADSATMECTPGPLADMTSYEWQVIAKNSESSTPGPIWVFTTGDSTPPILTLLGDAEVLLECNSILDIASSVWNDPGAIASDAVDGDLTTAIVTAGTVNLLAPGSYFLTYNVSDAAGNAAGQLSRTVIVRDTTPPSIVLNGSPNPTIMVNSGEYVEEGARVLDICQGELPANLRIDGTVDTTIPGSYPITYNAADDAGNIAATVERIVTVVPGEPPSITLNGTPGIVSECPGPYIEQGATATDTEGGSVEVIIGGDTVKPEVTGFYIITYNAVDRFGNQASEVIREVLVNDTVPPVLQINGDPEVTIECGGTYTDAGATATDACAGDLTASIQTTSTVDTMVPGIYLVAYEVSDGSGNGAQRTRLVIVADTQPPVLTLLGDAAVALDCGASEYVDAGATAADGCGGDLTAQVYSTGTVDLNASGNSTITYYVSDAAGNAATPVSRVVTVAANCVWDICGIVRNSLTGNGVEGVYVEISAVIDKDKAIAFTYTGADGSYCFRSSDIPSMSEGPYMLTFARPEYVGGLIESITAPNVNADVDLIPAGITRPCQPIATSGPKSVYVSWPPNPEYDLKGYNVYRADTDANGNPRGAAVKINGDPVNVYDSLVNGTEYIDTNIAKGSYYMYQIQAISAADRPSKLSNPSSPAIKGEWLTVFFPPEVNWLNTSLNAYLWNIDSVEKAVIPVCSRCVYDVNASSMNIVGYLPKALINLSDGFDWTKDLLLSGVTAAMDVASANVRAIPGNEDFYELSIAVASADSFDLYGEGALFYVALTPSEVSGCGDTLLLEDILDVQDGVRFYDDPFQPPLDLELQNGMLCNQGGCIHGDANSDGTIDAQDAQWVTDYYCKLAGANACTPQSADINLDGKINSADATLILRWLNDLSIAPPPPTKGVDLSDVSFAVNSAKDGPPQVIVDTVTGQPGETVNVPIYIQDAKPTAGYTITVGYKAGPEGLAYTGYTVAKEWASKDTQISVTNEIIGTDKGVVYIAFSADSSIALGKGALVTLNFTVPEPPAKGEQDAVYPINLMGASLTDQYGFEPGFTSPAAPDTVNGGIVLGEEPPKYSSADVDANNKISLQELLRVIQFFNMGGYECDTAGSTADKYVPGPGTDHACAFHTSDFQVQDWKINLQELLRLIQFFNMGGYYACPDDGTPDGFCPGPAPQT